METTLTWHIFERHF